MTLSTRPVRSQKLCVVPGSTDLQSVSGPKATMALIRIVAPQVLSIFTTPASFDTWMQSGAVVLYSIGFFGVSAVTSTAFPSGMVKLSPGARVVTLACPEGALSVSVAACAVTVPERQAEITVAVRKGVANFRTTLFTRAPFWGVLVCSCDVRGGVSKRNAGAGGRYFRIVFYRLAGYLLSFMGAKSLWVRFRL